MSEPSQHCSHPWLRVTCGVCGEAVDALGETPSGPGAAPQDPAAGRTGSGDSRTLFIVARGHPELLDQLRVVMGHQSGVHIIEDRRQRPRQDGSDEARARRRRLREEGLPDEG